MNKPINATMAKRFHGVFTHHEEMPNGETRFRLKREAGNGYIFTSSGAEGAWQRSHSHKFIVECYLVEKGWMALAKMTGGSSTPSIEIIEEGGFATVEPTVPHNVYLPTETLIHSIKMNSQDPTDWIPEPEMDKFTLFLSEADILRT